MKNLIHNLIVRTVAAIIRFEHIIYCSTNCKISLPLHKQYYKWCEKHYMEYRKKVSL